MKLLFKKNYLLTLCVALCVPVFADTGDNMPEFGFEPAPAVETTQKNDAPTVPENATVETPQSQSPTTDEAISTAGDSMPEFPLSSGEQTIQMPELPALRWSPSSGAWRAARSRPIPRPRPDGHVPVPGIPINDKTETKSGERALSAFCLDEWLRQLLRQRVQLRTDVVRDRGEDFDVMLGISDVL